MPRTLPLIVLLAFAAAAQAADAPVIPDAATLRTEIEARDHELFDVMFVWQRTADGWRMSRALSYDHGAASE